MSHDDCTGKSTKELLDEYSLLLFSGNDRSVERVREIVEELKRRGAVLQPSVPKRLTNRRRAACRKQE
jgi:hypothetical protein